MNFLEAFNELNDLNEEILTEKLWIAINPVGSKNYYRFYTVSDKSKSKKAQKADIADLLSTRNGTYKQTLNQKELASLVAELKQASTITGASKLYDHRNYSIETDLSNVDQANIKTLTMADRALRQKAHKDVNRTLKNNATAKLALEDKLQGRKYLIHHEDNDEDNNKLSNLILVPYFQNDEDDLKVANGIHSLLHAIAKKNAKTFSINYSTDVYYFDSQGKIQVGTVDIVVNPKK